MTLADAGIETVYVSGVASDFCVGYTAVDALSLGLTTFVVDDLIRGVADEGMMPFINSQLSYVSLCIYNWSPLIWSNVLTLKIFWHAYKVNFSLVPICESCIVQSNPLNGSPPDNDSIGLLV